MDTRIKDFMNNILGKSEKEQLVLFGELQVDLAESEDIPKGYTPVGFECHGTWVTAPGYDETLRFSVDPYAYYGEENINQFIKGMENVILKVSLENLRDAFYLTEQAMENFDSKRDINDYIVPKDDAFEGYPFSDSFDELSARVDSWVDGVKYQMDYENKIVFGDFQKYYFSSQDKELLSEPYELFLVTDLNAFYVKERESDENCNTVMMDLNGKVISDNHFAFHKLIENMDEIAIDVAGVRYCNVACETYVERIRKEKKDTAREKPSLDKTIGMAVRNYRKIENKNREGRTEER